MKNNLIVYGQLALGMAIFGSGTPISKIVTDSFPIFTASMLRMLTAVIVLLPFAYRERDSLRDLPTKDKRVLGAIAVVGMFLFSVFMLLGMQQISGVIGSIIMSTTPAVTAIGAWLFLNNQFGWRRIIAVVLAVAGVVILQVSSAGESGSSGNVLLGSLLIFGAVCSEAGYTLFGKVATTNLSPVIITAVTAALAIPLFLPFAIYELATGNLTGITLTDWLAVLWWGVGTLALGTVIWYSGVQQVEGSIASGFMGVMPVSALVLSYILLGEAFQPVHLVGFGIVLFGIGFITWAHRRESQTE